jgi:hypothetical protein
MAFFLLLLVAYCLWSGAQDVTETTNDMAQNSETATDSVGVFMSVASSSSGGSGGNHGLHEEVSDDEANQDSQHLQQDEVAVAAEEPQMDNTDAVVETVVEDAAEIVNQLGEAGSQALGDSDALEKAAERADALWNSIQQRQLITLTLSLTVPPTLAARSFWALGKS